MSIPGGKRKRISPDEGTKRWAPAKREGNSPAGCGETGVGIEGVEAGKKRESGGLRREGERKWAFDRGRARGEIREKAWGLGGVSVWGKRKIERKKKRKGDGGREISRKRKPPR